MLNKSILSHVTHSSVSPWLRRGSNTELDRQLRFTHEHWFRSRTWSQLVRQSRTVIATDCNNFTNMLLINESGVGEQKQSCVGGGGLSKVTVKYLKSLTGSVEHDQSVFLLLQRLPEILWSKMADVRRFLFPGLFRRGRSLRTGNKTYSEVFTKV